MQAKTAVCNPFTQVIDSYYSIEQMQYLPHRECGLVFHKQQKGLAQMDITSEAPDADAAAIALNDAFVPMIHKRNLYRGVC